MVATLATDPRAKTKTLELRTPQNPEGSPAAPTHLDGGPGGGVQRDVGRHVDDKGRAAGGQQRGHGLRHGTTRHDTARHDAREVVVVRDAGLDRLGQPPAPARAGLVKKKNPGLGWEE